MAFTRHRRGRSGSATGAVITTAAFTAFVAASSIAEHAIATAAVVAEHATKVIIATIAISLA